MDEEKDGINEESVNKKSVNESEEEVKKEGDEQGSTEESEQEEIKDKEIEKDENKEENKDDDEQENEPEVKARNEDEEYKVNRNNRKVILGIIVIITAIILLIIMVYTTSKYDNLGYPGVSVYEESVSKLNKEEVSKKLIDIENKIKKNKIYIEAKEEKYDVNLNDIILNYNSDNLIKDVIDYGKDKNMFEQFTMILLRGDKNYKFDIKVDKNKVKEITDQVAKESNKKPEESKAIIDGSNIEIKEGEEGIKLNEQDLINKIEETIKKANIYSDNITINPKYETDYYKIKKEDLKKVDTKVSSFSTHYGAGGGRGSNIENAVKKLDDLILMPGDEFSYENLVGPVVKENGYTYAPVIINGELEDGIGGGVCQVSSTIYNAQLMAGILPTERQNHSKAVNYVPRGLDATLASGSIDYKFKNTYEYPLILNSYTSNGNIYIEFWSNKEAKKGIEYKPVSYVRGNLANTYLYGYDKSGKKVYEKYIDASFYR